jgi:hypothetical protein
MPVYKGIGKIVEVDRIYRKLLAQSVGAEPFLPPTSGIGLAGWIRSKYGIGNI